MQIGEKVLVIDGAQVREGIVIEYPVAHWSADVVRVQHNSKIAPIRVYSKYSVFTDKGKLASRLIDMIDSLEKKLEELEI